MTQTKAPPEVDFQCVETGPELDALCAQIRREDILVIDTEFVRIDTYYPRAGLIQICRSGQVWLIDPLMLADLTPLADLLCQDTATAPLVVMHSASEDLAVFKRLWDRLPTRLFDTQIAQSFLGAELQMGLQRLVALQCGVALPKGETRSDWLARPLSARQLQYAALDVYMLEQVYHHQCAVLQQAERYDWVLEESALLRSSSGETLPPAAAYRRIRDAWRLDRGALRRLKRLAQWRESFAIEHDIARNFVVSDPALLWMAREYPQTLSALKPCSALKPVQIRKYGELVLEQLRQLEASDEPLPAALDQPWSKRITRLARALKPVLAEAAEQLQLTPERLASSKQLEKLVEARLDDQPPPANLMQGWRRAWIPRLIVELDRKLSEASDQNHSDES